MGAIYIVDGVLEQNVIKRLCPGRPVRRTNLNGKSVHLVAIAKRVATLIRVSSGDYDPIIVIVDREQRDLSSDEMEIQTKELLRQDDLDTSRLVISCPDRMIENWICAGTIEFQDNPICQGDDVSFDDLHGKARLKGELLQFIPAYREATTGVDLFCKINVSRARLRSASFCRFSEQVEKECRWMAGKIIKEDADVASSA